MRACRSGLASAFILSGALSLAGCGPAETEGDPVSPAPTPPAPEAPAPAAAAGGEVVADDLASRETSRNIAPADEPAPPSTAEVEVPDPAVREDPGRVEDDQHRMQAVSAAAAEEVDPVRTYTVRPGDTLASIARAEYGDISRYREIYEANRDQLAGPDHIEPGQVLSLP